MQFKYPELLWALFLLLIPIIIHLFQLRRFKKTPFTNVKFLKKVVVESRRSKALKKWLLLFTRLALLAAIVLAFAQPFFAKKEALKQKEAVIYLDDSFSMQMKSEGTSLLQNAVQQLIQSVPKSQKFTLFTNTRTFRNTQIEDLQNDLLALAYSGKQLSLDDIYLKAHSLFSSDGTTEKNLIVVSDFQETMYSGEVDSLGPINRHFVELRPQTMENIAIDSVFFRSFNDDHLNLTVSLSSTTEIESTPVSLYNDQVLTAKSSAKFNTDKKGEVSFTIPASEVFKGTLEITDNGLSYDNRLYFNIDEKEKIKVLEIGPKNDSFLHRIYTEDEFELTAVTLNALNYGDIEKQHLVVLNELPGIPSPLTASLKAFIEDGGHLAIIPAGDADVNSYNLLTSSFGAAFGEVNRGRKNITHISFEHPLFRNVFEKTISNFQYPTSSVHYKLRSKASAALAFQDNEPFLVAGEGFYLFASPLSADYSNFQNAPLIVPTFYNIGTNSLKIPQLYYVLGRPAHIDVPINLTQDGVLKVEKENYELIPLQELLTHRVSMTFNDELMEDGIYGITDGKQIIGHLSFNHDRNESDLGYLNVGDIVGVNHSTSLPSLFQSMENDNRVTELWKWFAILALILLMVEILIQKLFK
ncbi:BatA domain-containing protein [Pseudozobellia thermophila]|nr:BatA domain-containing protein [Pseudozobellia thermophila]